MKFKPNWKSTTVPSNSPRISSMANLANHPRDSKMRYSIAFSYLKQRCPVGQLNNQPAPRIFATIAKDAKKETAVKVVKNFFRAVVSRWKTTTHRTYCGTVTEQQAVKAWRALRQLEV